MPISRFYALTGLSLFGCLLGVAPSAIAANQEVENLLAKIRNAYSSVKSAKYSTVVNFRNPPLHCTNYFLAPDKFRVDFPAEGASGTTSIISDGKTTYYLPAGQEMQHEPYDFENFFKLSPGHVETFSYFEWKKLLVIGQGMGLDDSSLKVLPNQEWNGRNWTVLEETKTSEKQVYHYYVDPKTFLIWRTTSLPFGATAYRVDTQLTKLELGISVPASMFKVSG
jgi:outer membrane lipoprotein-sorting protein